MVNFPHKWGVAAVCAKLRGLALDGASSNDSTNLRLSPKQARSPDSEIGRCQWLGTTTKADGGKKSALGRSWQSADWSE